jgi:hypothetical protein
MAHVTAYQSLLVKANSTRCAKRCAHFASTWSPGRKSLPRAGARPAQAFLAQAEAAVGLH